jgi:hypothetical protein
MIKKNITCLLLFKSCFVNPSNNPVAELLKKAFEEKNYFKKLFFSSVTRY